MRETSSLWSSGPALVRCFPEDCSIKAVGSQPHYMLLAPSFNPFLFTYPHGASLAFNPSTSRRLFLSGRKDVHKLCALRLTFSEALFSAGMLSLQGCLLSCLAAAHHAPCIHHHAPLEYLVWCHWLVSNMASQSHPEGASLHVHRTFTLTPSWVAWEP